jgi:hypothetical protein
LHLKPLHFDALLYLLYADASKRSGRGASQKRVLERAYLSRNQNQKSLIFVNKKKQSF